MLWRVVFPSPAAAFEGFSSLDVSFSNRPQGQTDRHSQADRQAVIRFFYFVLFWPVSDRVMRTILPKKMHVISRSRACHVPCLPPSTCCCRRCRCQCRFVPRRFLVSLSRPDRGQRGGHRGDEPAAGVREGGDRPPRRRRQCYEGDHKGAHRHAGQVTNPHLITKISISG